MTRARKQRNQRPGAIVITIVGCFGRTPSARLVRQALVTIPALAGRRALDVHIESIGDIGAPAPSEGSFRRRIQRKRVRCAGMCATLADGD